MIHITTQMKPKNVQTNLYTGHLSKEGEQKISTIKHTGKKALNRLVQMCCSSAAVISCGELNVTGWQKPP